MSTPPPRLVPRARLASRASRASRAGVALAVVLAAAPAGAALSASQKALVRDHYAQADEAAAGRLRALLARPDLAPDEVAEVFAQAARRARFDERREAFVRSLLFGPASQASRSELVPGVVAGLLARSAEVAASTGPEEARAEELLRIHRFVSAEIAGASGRQGAEAAGSLREDARRACVRAYREHLGLPVLERGRIKGPLRAARAQAELALLELSEGLFPVAEAAAWIGAGAAEREALEKTGVLVLGLDGAPAARSAAVVQLLAAAPQAARGASALWIGKPWPRGLSGRRAILVAQASLAGKKRADPGELWPPVVLPSAPDAALAQVAFTLARAGVAASVAADAALAEAARAALARARTAGAPAVLGVQALAESLDPAAREALAERALLAHAAQLLLLDAPRAAEAALASAAAGRHEPLEQLALALGALAAGDRGALADRLLLGRTGEAGGLAPVEVSGIRGTAARVERFSIEGQEIALARGPDGAVAGVTLGGKAVTLAALAMARVPAAAGERWDAPAARGRRSALALRRMVGQPEVGFADPTRLVVRSPGDGQHAASLQAPGADVEAEMDVLPLRAPAAIVARASAGAAEAAGVALVIEPGEAPRASLVLLDGSGRRAPLAGPSPLPRAAAGGFRVKLKVRGPRVTADVAGVALSAELPAGGGGPAGREVAIAPGARGEVEVRNLKVKAAGQR